MYSFILLFLCSYVFSAALSATCDNYDDFSNTQLIVSISAVEKSQFRIYWNHPKFISGDSLKFYKGNPVTTRTLSPIFTHELNDKTGFVETGVHAAPAELGLYHAALLRDGKVKKLKNLSPKPHWMEERRAGLENFNLRQLVIPGTHGSGFYIRPVDNNILHPKIFTLKWTQTQDLSIKEQLEYGIRYLDVRPAWNGKKYMVNHAAVQMIPMTDVINEVNEFLNNTQEIVILSFKEFPHGFSSSEDHRKFSEYIEKAFETHLQPYDSSFGGTMTLGDFWKSNKRLVIAYDSDDYHHPTFWRRIRQFWGDCRSVECLHSYLQKVHSGFKFSQDAYYPSAAMTELTHDAVTGIPDAVKPVGKSKLRKWADEVGALVPQWYNDWSATANIIATDFFLSSGIVDVAIYWNERRSNYCIKE